MLLSPNCEKAFVKWISSDTWHTGHPHDKARFHGFVRAYLIYSRKPVQAYNLKADIIKRCNGKLEAELLAKKAEKYALIFEEIVDYMIAVKTNSLGLPFLAEDI